MPTPAPAGSPTGPPLGAQLRADGTGFALWAPRASRVELVLLAGDQPPATVDLRLGEGGIWRRHVPGVGAGQGYGYRVHGPWAPERGERFDADLLLLDPYARAVTEADDGRPLGIVVADAPPPAPVARPVPLADTVVYELHVKGFTARHPAVPAELRGSYAGLASPAVLDHLTGLGVTAVELLPVHHFCSEPGLTARGLTNYWGYNSIGFFAPHAGYAATGQRGQQVAEFRAMVAAFHAAGLEVILDVVYNHTGEGGQDGPTWAFRGIDEAGYYRLSDDLRRHLDVTGCGNSLDTSHPAVRQLIVDSLRYWVSAMGVDGFRFDLATTLIRDGKHHVDLEHPLFEALAGDPVLRDTKIIVEPWDLGTYGYRLGGFGTQHLRAGGDGASEWNDRFRGQVRDFWRGHAHGVSELAARLAGSPDIFGREHRPATASLNFVTAHDGFTLRDLVSYNVKHNTVNGEHNRDGSDDNRSWNCGVEGETDDPSVRALRRRQAQNMMATLVLATGVPMITGGDELGRTQSGNNNAYCQDNELSWVDWGTAAEWADLTELTTRVLRLRAEHAVFRPARYRHGEPILDANGRPSGRRNLVWFGGGGDEMTPGDWADAHRRTLGMYLADDAEDRETDDAFLVWLHAGPDPVDVVLPDGPWAQTYSVVLVTGSDQDLPEDKIPAGSRLRLPARTLAVLQVD